MNHIARCLNILFAGKGKSFSGKLFMTV